MFGSVILDVAIGIIFIFILVSIICTAIREGIEAWLKTRSAYLERGIRELLQDTGAANIAKSFYQHPLISGLYTGSYTGITTTGKIPLLLKGGNLPSYIPSKNFALTLMDIAARGPVTDKFSSDPDSPSITLESIRMNIANIGNASVQRVLLNAIDTAQGDLNQLQANLEAWYNSSMDRVSGWYKRSTQWVVFWIGLAMAVVLNINTITIASYLSQNQTARSLLVDKATALAKDSTSIPQTYSTANTELSNLSLPIGWEAGWGLPGYVNGNKINFSDHKLFWCWLYIFGPVLGWLVTAIAATLGAPFWFDVLNRVMVIRSTVKPHEKSQEEASEDRQPPKQQTMVTAPNQVQPDMQQQQQLIQSATLPTDELTDGCDIMAVELTKDEDLPASKGGVI